MTHAPKAAELGVPSLVWRAGQQRRFQMIQQAAGDRIKQTILDNGCGIGMYVAELQKFSDQVFGLEYDHAQAIDASSRSSRILRGAGEQLPFQNNIFDLILSHEVIEHVQDDRAAISEIIRSLKPGGRLVLFCPNRGYPVETHGVYWRDKYYFGNKLLVNYLPRMLRDKLAPHVRVYSRKDLEKLFKDMPVKIITQTIIFGAYDNIIARFPLLGQFLRRILQWLERTPLKILGLSHFWVVEKLEK